MYIEKDMVLLPWINSETSGFNTVVELGAGFFNRLESTDCKYKIGIEIWAEYIANAKYNKCTKIQGDLLEYRRLLPGLNLGAYVCMLIDVLEHFDKEVAIKLIKDLKKDFKKIILMIPCGIYAQDKDVTGYGAHEYQTHRSYWSKDDILNLDFQENINSPDFHLKNVKAGDDTSCFFCTWERPDER
jgi:hypothetical protein